MVSKTIARGFDSFRRCNAPFQGRLIVDNSTVEQSIMLARPTMRILTDAPGRRRAVWPAMPKRANSFCGVEAPRRVRGVSTPQTPHGEAGHVAEPP